MNQRTALSTLLAASLWLLGSCSSPAPETQTAPPAPPSESAAQPGSVPQAADEKIKFKQADGSERFSIKFKPDGAKLVDGEDRELARFTLDADRKIKIKDAEDSVLGYVVSQDGYWKLENAEQTEELFILRQQPDGDLKLEDGRDRALYRIKLRDYGYEIETPEKQSLYKVKAKEGKISLRDASDQTVLSTRSAILPAAVACFGFDELTPEQQAALAYAVNLAGGER
ncbi:hypothetical protein IQ241_22505 [Romeria aff. gracilis LEGE 07310]|uniref:Lipoprotein n=1 Tax=Vasconcelosia minhoensis LEGE 07310 TaxID=915328 RepID=A0A8J7A9V0_9CYAN|nr:hypothetical protein [Romeria gracilis]MBE9080027.1 hypothetical protein [Romeria aff. gracilis LEGE 07310]